MPTTYNLGSNVGAVIGLLWGVQRKETQDAFAAYLKELKYKHLLAITTADQKSAAKVLQENGFKFIVNFKSSHGYNENLKMWVKTQKNYRRPTGKKKVPYGNCSVSFNGLAQKPCSLVISSKRKKGIKKVRGTPIYYRVRKKDFIK